MTALEDFLYWVLGIQEDDPLPYEINYIYFLISFSNNACTLVYAGSENFEKQPVNFEYFPLEAQYFYNQTFNQITEINLALLALKQLLEDSFDNPEFKKMFKNKKIYFGEFAKSVTIFDNNI